jgi:spore germination protein GerM
VELYFTVGGKLAAMPAEVSGSAPAKESLEQLLKGPKDPRHSTEIPPAAKLEDLSISGRVASASFNDAFFAPNGASGTLLRLAQVVYTLTQFPGVTSVRFLKNGQALDVIGEGFPLNRPLTRGDFSHVLP